RFLQGAGSSDPIHLHVERMRDGSLLSSRRVEVLQSGQRLFTLDASFGRPPESDTFQRPAPVAPRPHPGQEHHWQEFDQSMGLATSERLGGQPGENPGAMGRTRRVWARPQAPVPEDPLGQAMVMALFSDTRTGMTAKGSVGRDTGERASS